MQQFLPSHNMQDKRLKADITLYKMGYDGHCFLVANNIRHIGIPWYNKIRTTKSFTHFRFYFSGNIYLWDCNDGSQISLLLHVLSYKGYPCNTPWKLLGL
jgi:hypothetical protein